jgi:hypothetical protein
MHEPSVTVHRAIRRLSRRLTLGLFLDVWPRWAVPAVLGAGVVVLLCRLFAPAAAPYLRWLWLVPLVAAVPACFVRRYQPSEVAAIADWLSGGHGLLLTLHETGDAAWARSPLLQRSSAFAPPRLRPWRRLAPLAPALVFLTVASALPQRARAEGPGVVAAEIAADLDRTVAELKQQALVTPEEERALDEQIERIRQGAEERLDAGAWEAADALRERLASDLAAKQDALRWAGASLARYGAAVDGAGSGDAPPDAAAAELSAAIDKLAKSGLLASASPELQRQLKSGKLPADAASLRELSASLAKFLGEANGRFGEVAKLGKEFGRFDPTEFPLGQSGEDGDGEPGRGGINRGRADAELTWGKESLPIDRFTSQPLPPGAGRPDDWTPVIELPGAPQESPVVSTRAAARRYAPARGEAAWRRTLAPRHQSAVKKYFAK